MFDLDRIARIVGGEYSGRHRNSALSGVSTDSRQILPGSLFIPLRGKRFDGHDYLGQAVQNGAAACLSEEVIEGLSVPVVRVADTLRALGDIAAAWRLQLRGPLIGITGSAGKTTTKEMLAAILARMAPGLKTAGNFNNLIGVPVTLLRLEAQHQWAVVEMGTSALGEIERLTEIAQPTYGIITNIGAAHLSGLHGLDGVARAKGELFAGLRGGTAVVNLDDPRVARLPVANGVKTLTYGEHPESMVRAERVIESDAGLSFELVYDRQRFAVQLPMPGRHHVSNALAAAAAALELEIPGAQVVAGLAEPVQISGRLKRLPLAHGGVLLDDSYNANPLSAAAALKAFEALPGPGRRVVVLGDMLELGSNAPRIHRELGEQAAAVADLLIAVGEHADDLGAGAEQGGIAADAVVRLKDVDAAIAYLVQRQQAGDRILVKGSRGVALDKLVEVLQSPGESSRVVRKGD